MSVRWGIVGPGRIGRETARLAEAFGAHVLFARRGLRVAVEQGGYVGAWVLSTDDAVGVRRVASAGELDELGIDKAVFLGTSLGGLVTMIGRSRIVTEKASTSSISPSGRTGPRLGA